MGLPGRPRASFLLECGSGPQRLCVSHLPHPPHTHPSAITEAMPLLAGLPSPIWVTLVCVDALVLSPSPFLCSSSPGLCPLPQSGPLSLPSVNSSPLHPPGSAQMEFRKASMGSLKIVSSGEPRPCNPAGEGQGADRFTLSMREARWQQRPSLLIGPFASAVTALLQTT